MPSLKFSRSYFYILPLLLLLIGGGYLRQEYFLLWEYPLQFSLIEREKEYILNHITFKSQLPGLMLYLILFYFGNSLLLMLLLREKYWWYRLFILYVAIVLLGALFLFINIFLESYLLVRAAQILKELVLSPLPFLLIIPFKWWENRLSAE